MSPCAVNQLRAVLESLPEILYFAKFPIERSTVFYATEHTFAFTNLKPVVPGHVLVSPRRVVDRMASLSDVEAGDLFCVAKFIGRVVLSAHPEGTSLTFTVQDGPAAGQTVPHVHVHVLPRFASDKFNSCAKGNDAVYEAIGECEKDILHVSERVDEELSAPPRTREEMALEAKELRHVAQQLLG